MRDLEEHLYFTSKRDKKNKSIYTSSRYRQSRLNMFKRYFCNARFELPYFFSFTQMANLNFHSDCQYFTESVYCNILAFEFVTNVFPVY